MPGYPVSRGYICGGIRRRNGRTADGIGHPAPAGAHLWFRCEGLDAFDKSDTIKMRLMSNLKIIPRVFALLLPLVTAPALAACPDGQMAYRLANRCPSTLWIGQNAAATLSHPPDSGWELPPGGERLICAPRAWSAVRLWGRAGCAKDAAGHLSCLTGQCGDPGRIDCGAGAGQASGANPQTLFEVTMLADGATSWDVSVVNGANVPMAAEADGQACNRSRGGCTADLNAVCPPALRKTIAPSVGGGPVACGAGTSCPAGACVEGSCVVGCYAPFDACGEANPPPGLMCSAAIPGVPPYTDCAGGSGPVTFEQMYGLKNLADGVPMASPHQGTPTCRADADCPRERPMCVTTGFDAGISPSAGAGVCIDPDPSRGAANDYASPAANCATAPVGEACGGYREVGYPDALGYTCRTLTYTTTDGRTATAHPCVPPTTSGLGSCHRSRDPAQPPLYTGVGGVWNPGWMAAARQAGGGGPFIDIFREACPAAYAWPYDDVAALYTCRRVERFTITFCPAGGGG